MNKERSMKRFNSNILYFTLFIAILSLIPGLAMAQVRNEMGKTNQDYYYEASKEKILGNYSKAVELFNLALELEPEDAASMYEIADIYSNQNKFDLALPLAIKAVETEPSNKWYKVLLIQLYQNSGQFDEATTVIRQLIKNEPDNIEYLQDLALNYIYASDYKEALKVLNQIENKLGVTEAISIQKQKIYLLQNKPEKAIEEIENLSAAYPDEVRYLEILAELLMAYDRMEEAVATYDRIREVDPENPYINISLSDYYRKIGDRETSFTYLKEGFANPALDIDTKVQILLAYYSVNEFYNEMKEEAFTLAEILVETHPDDPKSYSIYADLLYQDEQFEEAKKNFHLVLSIDDSKYLVWEQLLFVESELGDFNAMEEESSQALELFPQQPLLYLFNGLANFQLKNYKKSAESLEMGLKFVVGNRLLEAQFNSYLGDLYFQMDEVDKSYKAYDNVLRIDPDNSVVLNNYAYYLSLEGGDLDKAEKMAKRGVELDPENGANMDTYGWVLYKLGRYDEAKEWIGKALEANREESAVVIEHYGDALYQLGEKEEAVKYWERAKAAGEGSEFLEKKVKDKKLYE